MINNIINKINENGFFSLENFVDPIDIDLCRNYILEYDKKYNKNFYTKIDLCNEEGSIFNIFLSKYKITDLASEISNLNTDIKSNNNESLNVLRVIHSDPKNGNSLKFHFDASAVTILIPIEIPNLNSGDYSGSLIILPNIRKFNTGYFFNLLQKIILQNSLSRKLLMLIIRDRLEKYIVNLVPGNIYIFWGYRSLHANMSINGFIKRSTLIFHFNYIHSDSMLLRFIRSFRKSFEQSRLR